ncbi:hypothetical protein EXIGLDRAFT_366711 [Exidia glandulosa HHB12029]|uniref:BZIP domain-containing protein n=1 Tax=Exidia glandulosa HHB12029 TaxID=1314781 RepID=A0A165L731_EXIGL|nr:hypothetical protein EXIGLDRAFT_366711 [Exidia glandulosa HHB12029]
MSSSKRGRKRNDTLPPNRARDVQRAFRARRAAHLQDRVDILETENAQLREMLHMPPPDRPVLGRGPTGKDKPLYPSKGYNLPELSKVVPGTFVRSGSPSTEPSSAHTTSSASPTASQTWSDMNMQSHVLPGVWDDQNALSGHPLDSSRSPSGIALPKPAPFPMAPIGSHPSPPLRQLSAHENAFFPPSSSTESYTPGSPAFGLRDAREQDAYHHSNPYPQTPSFNASYQPMHNHSVSCEMPISTHAFSNQHAPSPPSRESSVGSISGHRRSITSPDLHVLNVNSSFPQQLPPPPLSNAHSHMRHPGDNRGNLQMHNIMHSGQYNS